MTLTTEDYQEMLERERDRQSDDRRADQQRRQDEERQRQRDYEQRMRIANDWNDAWWKARLNLEPTVQTEIRDNLRHKDDPTWRQDTWFQDALAATNTAEELYKKQMAAVADRITAIRQEAERQIAEIEQGVRAIVVAQIDARHGEGTLVAQALAENDPQLLLDW